MKKKNRALLLFRRPKWKQRVAWPEAAMEGQFSRLMGRDRDAPSLLLPFSHPAFPEASSEGWFSEGLARGWVGKEGC